MRNSSLVERSCAEDVTGLKLTTEAMDVYFVYVVEELPVWIEVVPKGAVDCTGVSMLA